MNDNISIWQRDLPKILQKFYKQSNTQVPPRPEHHLIDLIEWLLQIPLQVPRKVHVSPEVEQTILSEYEDRNLSNFIKLIERGENLKPYLGDTTRKIRNRHSNSTSHDLFMSDWGLLHFHLGADFEQSQQRAARTRNILIATLNKQSAYLIKITPHGEVGYGDIWGDTEYFKILHRNWPETFPTGILTDSDSERKSYNHIDVRNAGVNSPIFIDGNSFVTPGIGINPDGTNILAIFKYMEIKKVLENIEQKFRNKHPNVTAHLVVTMDASIGFLIPKSKQFECMLKYSDGNIASNFFKRLLDEIKMEPSKPYQEYITPKRLRA